MKKTFGLVIGICMVFFSFGQKKDIVNIQLKSDLDSSALSFCTVILFEDGYSVKDTITDINGLLSLKMGNFSQLENGKIYFRTASHFPKMMTLKEVTSLSKIYLAIDRVSIESGGMKSSEEVLDLNAEIEQLIEKWNRKFK
jgi:hypothetical protein